MAIKKLSSLVEIVVILQPYDKKPFIISDHRIFDIVQD